MLILEGTVTTYLSHCCVTLTFLITQITFKVCLCFCLDFLSFLDLNS